MKAKRANIVVYKTDKIIEALEAIDGGSMIKASDGWIYVIGAEKIKTARHIMNVGGLAHDNSLFSLLEKTKAAIGILSRLKATQKFSKELNNLLDDFESGGYQEHSSEKRNYQSLKCALEDGAKKQTILKRVCQTACHQNLIEKSIEWEAIKEDYAQPNTTVDIGNMYWWAEYWYQKVFGKSKEST